MVDGGHGAHTGAGHARSLRLHAHGKAGAVNEVNNRQMELRAKVHVAGDLVADIRRPRTIQEEGVSGQDADRVAVDTGKAADNAPAPIMTDLEEAASVDGRLHNLARLVRCLAIGRHDREKALLAAVWFVPRRHALRQFVHGGWQIGEEAARRLEGIGFAVNHIVDRAVLPLDFPAAEFFFRDVFAKRNRDRRTGHENLAEFLHHDREMAGGNAPRAHAGTGSERERHERHLRQAMRDLVPARRFRNIGPGILLKALDRSAAPGTVDHLDQRHPVFGGHLDHHDHFLPDRGIRRSAAYREVVGENNCWLSVQRGAPGDRR